MLLDVVISTRNSLTGKGGCLSLVIASLLRQKHVQLNIVIADNGSDDETATDLVNGFADKVTILDTSAYAGNLAASRNAGAACGKADFVLFSDDDMIAPRRDSLARCVNVVEDVDFACGARRLWAPSTWPRLIRCDDPINKVVSTLDQICCEPRTINRVSGLNIVDNRSYIANFGIVRRAAFEALGGFDEGYVGWGYSDTDLMHRLCVRGHAYDLFSNHDITVYHLAHKVDKGTGYEANRARFVEKLRAEGRWFHINHFFEIYENDGYSLFSDFKSANAP